MKIKKNCIESIDNWMLMHNISTGTHWINFSPLWAKYTDDSVPFFSTLSLYTFFTPVFTSSCVRSTYSTLDKDPIILGIINTIYYYVMRLCYRILFGSSRSKIAMRLHSSRFCSFQAQLDVFLVSSFYSTSMW